MVYFSFEDGQDFVAGVRVVNWDDYEYGYTTFTAQGIASALVEVVSRCTIIMFFVTPNTSCVW